MEYYENSKEEQEIFDRAATLISEEKNVEAKAILQNKNLHLKTDTAENLTLLHVAARSGNKDMTQHMIDLESNGDAQTASGLTPLMLAVQNQHLPIVEALLHTGTDLNILDGNGETADDIASRILHVNPSAASSDICIQILKRPIERAGGMVVDRLLLGTLSPFAFVRGQR